MKIGKKMESAQATALFPTIYHKKQQASGLELSICLISVTLFRDKILDDV